MANRASVQAKPDAEDNLLLRFDKFVVIYNPVSTNAKRSRRRIAELKELFPSKEVNIVETSPDGLEANKKLIVQESKKFDEDTLVCIAAGDGTVSAVLDSLLARETIPAKAKKVPVLPLWGGNANDLAYMINGRPQRISVKTIFEEGAIVPIYPIDIVFKTKERIIHKIAACYVSFGASAYAAQQTELPKNKKKRIHVVPGARVMNELFVVSKSLIRARAFTIKANNRNQSVYERIFVNGSRIAKIDRLPVKLNEKAFYEATIEKKNLGTFISLLSALKILRNRTYGEITGEDRSFILNDDTWAQIDGEVQKLSAGTEVRISLSSEPFYVISTKLKQL